MTSLADWIDTDSRADIGTVVSELLSLTVTGGGGGPIDMRLELSDSEVFGEIEDAGRAAAAHDTTGCRDSSELALRIVDAIVDDWGADPVKTRVWFRMCVNALE